MPCQGPIHLRRAVIDDAPEIAQVHVRGWRATHSGLLPDAYLAGVRTAVREGSWRDELAVEASDRAPWVALVGDRVVGFISVGLSRDEDADSETGEIYVVYVDPECQGRGIGSNLLEHGLRDLRGHGFVQARIWVVADDARARGLATQKGWSPDGATRFEDYGGTQVEEVRYRLALR